MFFIIHFYFMCNSICFFIIKAFLYLFGRYLYRYFCKDFLIMKSIKNFL